MRMGNGGEVGKVGPNRICAIHIEPFITGILLLPAMHENCK